MQTITTAVHSQLQRIEQADRLVDEAVEQLAERMRLDHYPARIHPHRMTALAWSDKVPMLRRIAELVAAYERSSHETRSAARWLRQAVDRLALEIARMELARS